MTRNYKNKTDRGTFRSETMMEAVKLVIGGAKIKPTARDFGLNYNTLKSYVQIKQKEGHLEKASFGYSSHRKVLTDEIENDLVQYSIKASKIFYGLTLVEMRRLAYKCAIANNIKVPPSWTENEMAVEDWAERFMKRHPMIRLRIPEASSLQRMEFFHKHNVNNFYDNLITVMKEKSFSPDRIYNCNETGVTTIQRPTKQIAETGAKRAGSMMSQERGALVTVCCSVNAINSMIPPFCVFPRVRTLDEWK